MRVKKDTHIQIDDVEITPAELALKFCQLDSDEMAEFFNEIAFWSGQWDIPFEFQMQHVTDSKSLREKGRHIMKTIGEYSKKP